MKKKLAAMFLAAVLATALVMPIFVLADDGVRVILDGEEMAFSVPPQIINRRVMVPLRAIFEEMGAEVLWNRDTQTATATKDGTVVILTVGCAEPTVNGVVVPLDQAAVIVENRTLAPLRFVAEAFGGTVNWNAATQTATIFSADSDDAPEEGPQPIPERIEIYLAGTGLTDAQLTEMIASGEIPANVTRLILYDNEISDLTPLRGLTSLLWLNLNNNNISDLSPLSGLTALEGLHINSNNISNIAPLAQLTNLYTLCLFFNPKISDISPLAGHFGLTFLNLGANQISDISALFGLANLDFLFLLGNPVPQQDVDALRIALPDCRIIFEYMPEDEWWMD